MTRYLGDYREDTNVNIQWSTYDSAGLPVTRSPLGTIRIYKDNVATDNSTVGITDIANFD